MYMNHLTLDEFRLFSPNLQDYQQFSIAIKKLREICRFPVNYLFDNGFSLNFSEFLLNLAVKDVVKRTILVIFLL